MVDVTLRSRSFILVPIDFSYTTSYSNFCSRTHRLATIHNDTDDDDDDRRRRTQHCSNSATVTTVG